MTVFDWHNYKFYPLACVARFFSAVIETLRQLLRILSAQVMGDREPDHHHLKGIRNLVQCERLALLDHLLVVQGH